MALLPSDAGAAPVVVEDATAAVSIEAYGTLASTYVYRGIALRDRPGPGAAVSLTLPSGWFADSWTAPVDAVGDEEYDGELHRTWNIDAEAGYGARLSGVWQWTLAAARIIDIGGGGNIPAAYTEWRANLYFGGAAQAQFAYASDYEQRGWPSWTLEFGGRHPLTTALSGEWGVGHTHGAGRPDGDYSYGWLGLSGWYLRTQWDIRWLDSDHAARYVLDEDRSGSRFVLSLSWGVSLAP